MQKNFPKIDEPRAQVPAGSWRDFAAGKCLGKADKIKSRHGGRRRPPAAVRATARGRAPARKGRHGGRARALARHERPVDVAVRAPPARLLRRRATAAAAAAEPLPGDATITRGVVVCPARAVVAADGLVGSDHSSFLPHVLILTTISRAPPTPPVRRGRRQSRPRRPGGTRRAAREPSR